MRFVFCGEGNSDEALVSVIERLIIELGADRAEGQSLRPPTKPVGERLRWLAEQAGSSFDAWFIHRDADGPNAALRATEFEVPMDALHRARVIPVIPVQETEAWLLLDEPAIRRVVGRPRGTNSLKLPPAQRVEYTSNPKEHLWRALEAAADRQGRRRLTDRDRSDYRYQLLYDLDVRPDAPVRALPAFAALVDRVVERLVALGEISPPD
jgi:hypothetical protein